MESSLIQYVDPEVTHQKFQEELEIFFSLREEYRKKGVLLLEQQYPDLYFAFAAPSLYPMPIVFAVRINFVNYDVQPLSVKFVHPLTLEPITIEQVHTNLPRKLVGAPTPQALLQADLNRIPFFCIPGVREYHNHPFHNGDSWFLYRKKGGEGSLCFLLDNLELYGTSYLTAYTFQINLNMQIPNLQLGYNPEDLPL
ncbi:putative metal-binding protein [Pontibacter pudoricolor]|uniref:putative metal-binding protein n=1 Tax=Pontibacter pudoricolor TaxID=2694930 RepID=UPI001390EEC6|nr:putative metal-binding protein [Pontibacter pudoricolor]